MKTAKLMSVVAAAMLALSVKALSAVGNVAASTNRSGIVVTNAVAPARMSCADAADAAQVSAATNLPTLTGVDRPTTLSNNQAFNADACCSETKTLRKDFTLQADPLTKTPRDARARTTVRFFSDAVIITGDDWSARVKRGNWTVMLCSERCAKSFYAQRLPGLRRIALLAAHPSLKWPRASVAI